MVEQVSEEHSHEEHVEVHDHGHYERSRRVEIVEQECD